MCRRSHLANEVSTIMIHNIHDKIRILEIQLRELDIKKASLQEELKNAHIELEKSSSTVTSTEVHNVFSPEEKIKIFMNLFRG